MQHKWPGAGDNTQRAVPKFLGHRRWGTEQGVAEWVEHKGWGTEEGGALLY